MKKFLRSFLMAFIAIILCMFIACSSSSGGGSTGPGTDEDGFYQGWPPSNILTQYGLGGMRAPEGGSDFLYKTEVDEDGDEILSIAFKGDETVDNSVPEWLLSNHWRELGYLTYIHETNENWIATYVREGDVCSIVVIKMNDEDEEDPELGWPPNDILSQYGLSGMPAPAGATYIAYKAGVDEDGEYDMLAIGFNGNASVDGFVTGWLTSNGWTQTMEYEGIIMFSYNSNPSWTAMYARDNDACGLVVMKPL